MGKGEEVEGGIPGDKPEGVDAEVWKNVWRDAGARGRVAPSGPTAWEGDWAVLSRFGGDTEVSGSCCSAEGVKAASTACEGDGVGEGTKAGLSSATGGGCEGGTAMPS